MLGRRAGGLAVCRAESPLPPSIPPPGGDFSILLLLSEAAKLKSCPLNPVSGLEIPSLDLLDKFPSISFYARLGF